MINVWFTDFWLGYDKYNNYFTKLFDEFKVSYSINYKNVDLLIFSVFGNDNINFKCKKIFYTGENIDPKNYVADGYFSFDYILDEKFFRLPLYLLYDSYYELHNKKVNDSLLNRKFCSFIYTNSKCSNRNRIFNKLSKYKKVDSGGKFNNNIGYYVHDKLEFQKNYKFSIAYENEQYRYETNGYTTEKIVDSMFSNSIPIYWGNPLVYKDFNTKSFVNFYDFKNEDDMIDYIIFLDENDNEYLKVLNDSWLNDNKIPEELDRYNIANFIKSIIEK
jgi:hypothetical protein